MVEYIERYGHDKDECDCQIRKMNLYDLLGIEYYSEDPYLKLLIKDYKEGKYRIGGGG